MASCSSHSSATGSKRGGLPRDIVVEWAVTQLLRDSGAEVGDEQILMAAVARLDWNQAADPNKLFQRLAELGGSATQLLLAQQLANSVVDGTIAVEQASRYLIKMLAAGTDVVVLAALQQLSQPVFQSQGCPTTELLLLVDQHPSTNVVLSAIDTLACWPCRELLLERAFDEQRPRVRSHIFAALSKWAEAPDVDCLLDAAITGDLYGSGLAGVLQFQRIGLLLTRSAVGKLFDLSLTATHIKPETWAQLIGSHWGHWLKLLESLPPDDPNQSRQIRIVREFPRCCSLSVKQRSKPNLVHKRVFQFLMSLLGQAGFARQFSLLATSVSRLAVTSDEMAFVEARLLELLGEIPEAAFEGLRRVGSDATEQTMLRCALGELSLPISRTQARQWLLSTGRVDEAKYFLGDIRDWEPGLLKFISGSADPFIHEQLCDIVTLNTHPAQNEAIHRLAELGEHSAISALSQLLNHDDESKREAASEAIIRIGSRLFQSGRIRPACLLGANSAKQAGMFVLADELLDLIDNATSTDELTRLLTQLVGFPHPDLTARLHHLRTHSDQHVMKLVIEATIKVASSLDAIWLHNFVVGENHFLARQAINTIGALAATWACEDLIQALDHSNMNIKKSAAEALQTAGTIKAVKPIVHWLRTHDNPGFRNTLSLALNAIIGQDQARCVILSELQQVSGREIELLLDAVRGGIPVQTVIHTLQNSQELGQPAPLWLQTLFDRILSGEDRLRNATVDELRTTLVRRGLLAGPLQSKFEVPDPESARTPRHSETRASDTGSLAELRDNFDVVLADLVSDDESKRNDAMGLLGLHVGSLHRSEQAAVIESLRTALDQQALPVDRVLTVFRKCDAIVTKQVATLAWRFAGDPRGTTEDQRMWAFRAQIHTAESQSVTAEQLLLVLRTLRQKTHQEEAIQFGLNQGWHEELLADATRWHHTATATLTELWDVGPPAASRLIEVIDADSDSDEASSVLCRWLAEFPDPETEQWILSQIGHKRPYFVSPGEYVRSHWQSQIARQLLEKLKSPHRKVRVEAAEILVTASGEFRATVLQSYLDGELGDQPPLRVSVEELLAWPQFSSDVDARRIRLLSSSTGSVSQKLALSLSLYDQLSRSSQEQEEGTEDGLRAAIRRCPVSLVLNAIESAIHSRQWSYLDLLGSTSYVPDPVVDWLRSGDEETRRRWLEVLQRWANNGSLGESGLAEVLIDIAKNTGNQSASDAEQKRRLACVSIELCGQLARWAEPVAAAALLSQLTSFLECDDQRAATVEAAILNGIGSASAHKQAQLLMSTSNLASRPVFIGHIAELYLEHPSILETGGVPGPDPSESRLRENIKALLIRFASDREATRARMALRRLVEDHDGASEEILVESLQHPQSSVRAYAHRLLRRTVSRERYLEATIVLLEDRVPEFRKTAIRVLSFGKYQPAIRKIIPLLHDHKKHVDRTAREGLIHFGQAAVSTLRQALSRTRPDRRAELEQVIQAIESGSSSDR